MGAATASLEGFQANANALGNSLIRGLTLPTLALGGAAIKMAADYQEAMARVAGLTNATFAQVAGATEHFLKIAPQLAVGPTELANSLYFTASAGLKFAQAMQVTELAAKGAAIGMGSAADVSKVLIFALNTFGKSGLTAAHAMDVLTQGIKEGTAEPEDMAIALGRLLPIAREAGISFDEVVASVAQLTNLGLPVRVATTSLRALFQELLAPTQRANSSLKAIGVTAEQLRTALEAGPIVAFKLLTDATHGNIDAIHAIIPQIRGLTAFLGLTGANAKNLNDVFNRVRNSTGALDRAFAIISQTVNFKFKQALTSLQVAGIKVGNELLPTFTGLVNIIGDLAKALANMGPAGASAAAAFLLVGAAVGPVIKLIATIGAIGSSALGTVKGLTIGIGLFAGATALAFGSISSLAQGNITLMNTMTALIASFAAARVGLQLLQKAAATGALGADAKFLSTFADFGPYATAAAAGIAVLGTAIALVAGQANKLKVAGRDLSASLVQMGADARQTKDFFAQLSKNDLASTFENISKAAKTLGKPLGTSFTKDLNAGNLQLRNMLVSFQKTKPAAAAALQPYVAALTKAGTLGVSASEGLKLAGLNAKGLSQAISSIGFSPATDQAQKLIATLDALAIARKDIQLQTSAQLVLNSQEESAVSALAKQYGVSVDDVKSKASELGVSVLGLTDETQQAFAAQAGFVSDTSGNIQISLDDLMKTYTDASNSAIKDMNLFADAPQKINATLDQLVSKAQANAHRMATIARDEAILLQRGLSPGLVEQIGAGGPQMLEKFVKASAGQLGKLEASYQKSLEAIDAKIVLEGAHEETKGKNNILQFAAGMRSSLPQAKDAADRIIEAVALATESGKMSPRGFNIVQQFSNGMFAAMGIPQHVAEKIVIDFVNKLSSGDFDGAGAKTIDDYAKGIASKYNLPKSEAQAIAAGVRGALAVNASSVGAEISLTLAAGLNGSSNAAVQAAKALAGRVRSALSFVNSPELFTYYKGRELVKSLDRGLADEHFKGRNFTAGVNVKGDTMAGGGSKPKGVELHIHGDVYGWNDFKDKVDQAMTEVVNLKL